MTNEEFAGASGTIHYGHWEPAEPSALVVFLHGLGEHIGSYRPMFDTLTAAGIAVWALDHAGHGRSEGERVLVERVDNLLDDAGHLVTLARAAHPDLPLVLVGHSLGASVATLLAAERDVKPVKLVLAGSSVVMADAPGGLVELLASGIDPMDLRKDPGELTRNTEYAQQIREDPLTWQGGLRPQTLMALAEAAPRLTAALPRLTLPVLLLHGEDDDLAPVAGAREAARRLPDARLVTFALDRHNILNELDRDEVHRVLVAFVRA
ncbi:alpha/beta fold hydrolase [Kutzneria chonburiensis]|uniref:Alpha/beta fold hydrolase n=1 Tax=Kutzneria chonburiensis TaxID=1483604 RepID=A0ABV6MU27_9PSEU|nr:alpha/beta fold hydrolase [Kutzneria chonburiensis]